MHDRVTQRPWGPTEALDPALAGDARRQRGKPVALPTAVFVAALLGAGAAATAHAERPDADGWRAHVARLAAMAEDGDGEAALRLAGGHAARGEVEEALRWAAFAEAGHAHPVRLHLVRAEAFLSAGRHEEAIREAFEATQSAPTNAQTHLLLWRAVHGVDRTQLSTDIDLSRLRTLLDQAGFHLPASPKQPPEPGAAASHTQRGFEQARAGRFDAAADTFRTALQHDPGHAEAHRGLGVALAGQHRIEAALGAYRVYLHLATRETHDTRRIRRLLDDAERQRGLTPRPR